jgi:hypothetical protein
MLAAGQKPKAEKRKEGCSLHSICGTTLAVLGGCDHLQFRNPRLNSELLRTASWGLAYAIHECARRRISSCSEIFITLMESDDKRKRTRTPLAELCV